MNKDGGQSMGRSARSHLFDRPFVRALGQRDAREAKLALEGRVRAFFFPFVARHGLNE